MPFNAKWFSLKAGLNVAASPDTAGSAAIGGLYCCTIGVWLDRSEVFLLIRAWEDSFRSGGKAGAWPEVFAMGARLTCQPPASTGAHRAH